MPQTGARATGLTWQSTGTDPLNRVYCSVLLDFFGELLSKRQQECCELYFNEDLSLSEIAETCGISRQGAWDNIRRGTKALEEIEKKTGLLQRFASAQGRLKHCADLLRRTEECCTGDGELLKLVHAANVELDAILEDGGLMEHGL